MPNYQSRVSSNEDTDKLLGGALNMLSQYEANTEGDEYSSKNPSSKFLQAQDIQSLKNLADASHSSGGALMGEGGKGEYEGGGLGTDLAKMAVSHIVKNPKHALVASTALKLTPVAFHALKHTANAMKSFFKGRKSKTHKGDLDFTTKKGDKDFHEGGHDESKKVHPFEKVGGGAFEMGALDDISKAQHPYHIAEMVRNDHHLGGGSFLHTLGDVAKTVAPFLAFL